MAAMTAVAAMITVAIAFICWTKPALACGVIFARSLGDDATKACNIGSPIVST
jgi:hypothetical protein